MSLSPSFKQKLKNYNPSLSLLLVVACTITALSGLVANLQLDRIQEGNARPSKVGGHRKTFGAVFEKILGTNSSRGNNPYITSPSPGMGPLPPPPPASSENFISFSHVNIITTVFWAGEGASGDNGGIANSASVWDEQWAMHYGGVDNPTSRNGYLPAAFIPKENPFYIALPYSDISEAGVRKPSATNCPLYASQKSSRYSWCKNSWAAVRCHDKIAFGQWQDAGPFGEDDIAYVFGGSRPANKEGESAGLDVSPALQDYLGIKDVDSCDWSFVSFPQVTDGPWRQIITTSSGTNSVD